jgi:hypothetical protein
MGYRSEVGFVVPSSAPKFEEIEDVFDKVIEKDGFRLYYCDWIKWYDYSDDENTIVTAVEKYFDSLDHEDRMGEYYFIRLGEEFSDVDYRGENYNNPFNLGHSRTLTFTE